MEVRAPVGHDPATMNLRRFCNLAYVTLFELLPDPLWDKEEHRRKVVLALAWPEDTDAEQMQDQATQTRRAAQSMGARSIGDAQFQEAWEAYNQALELRRAREEEAAAPALEPGPEEPPEP